MQAVVPNAIATETTAAMAIRLIVLNFMRFPYIGHRSARL
jgi:hypothetical protein